MDNIQKVLASRIKHFREIKGFTQAELAERTGKSLSAIRQIEICATWPGIETLDAVATALNTTVANLFKTDDEIDEEENALGEVERMTAGFAEDPKTTHIALSWTLQELQTRLKILNIAVEKRGYPAHWLTIISQLSKLCADFSSALEHDRQNSKPTSVAPNLSHLGRDFLARLASANEDEIHDIEMILEAHAEEDGKVEPKLHEAAGKKRNKR